MREGRTPKRIEKRQRQQIFAASIWRLGFVVEFSAAAIFAAAAAYAAAAAAAAVAAAYAAAAAAAVAAA